MPVAIIASHEHPASPPRKRWTRTEVRMLAATGLWDASSQLELIEGELIQKVSKNQPHVVSTRRVVRCLEASFPADLIYQEAPIYVAPKDNPSSEPEPDVIVLKPAFAGFRPEQPKPEELALVVEVSDSTLQFDLTVKALLYARAGIEDYWVLDLNGRRMIVHRNPVAGVYQLVEAYGGDELVSPLGAPGHSLLVRDVLI